MMRRSVCWRVKTLNPPAMTGPSIYAGLLKKSAGVDESVKNTEMYDGYTDDFGVFKEGPTLTLRLEYLRTPEHGDPEKMLERTLWSPFQVPRVMQHYTPLWYDHKGFSSRDYYGHRTGTNPGSRQTLGHYREREYLSNETRQFHNHQHVKRIPKWLSCVVHNERTMKFVGFFLYANGAYAVELLTYKQLPRLVYNKPFQGCIPTLGQTVDLTEVTYGKEIHSLELYPGYGSQLCRASGTSAVVLRGSEPKLVPILLPSREVRLFDDVAQAVFGRRAGVMYNRRRLSAGKHADRLRPHAPRTRNSAKPVSVHPGGGVRNTGQLVYPLDWRIHPRNNVRTKYWLSGYILRGRQYNKHQSTSDLKSKTYSWANRDKVYR